MSHTIQLAFLLVTVLGDVQSVRLRLKYYSYSTYSYGRLEVYDSNAYEWIPFTITGFDMQAADLACKSLGYGFASRYATVESLGYEQASTTISASSVQCPSSAASFDSCTHYTLSLLSHSYDVGLECSNSKSSLRLLSSSGYTVSSSGRLQIYINNTWGTVCDDDFGSLEAGIACRQLGFSGYSYYDSVDDLSQYSSYISGPIWLDNLNQCTYSSSDLRNCTDAVGRNDCSHSEDIVLTCHSTSTAPTYSSGDVRLVRNGHSSSRQSSGRLEVYYRTNSNEEYAWTPICYYGFSSLAADYACRQLGFDKVSSYDKVGRLGYGWNADVDSITSVSCYYYSYNKELRYCTFTKSSSNTCSHYYDVALSCANTVSTAALASGLVLGFLVLCSCVFLGVTLSAVAVVTYRKKKLSVVRTMNVAEHPSDVNYRLSDVTQHGSNTVPTPIPTHTYTPISFTPIVLQQEESLLQNQRITESATVEEEDRDSIEDGDDTKPLMA